MLGKICQWLKRFFQRLFSLFKEEAEEDHTQAPPSLTDTDYEFLFNQLLEGVAHDWNQGQILKFFEDLGERGNTEQWVAWLRRFGERVLASPAPNRELGERMVRLGDRARLLPSIREIGAAAYEIGRQLLIRETSGAVGEDGGQDSIPPQTSPNPQNAANQPTTDETEAWFNRGLQQAKAGDLESEIASYDQALKFKPDDDQAWYNRGVALGDLGRYSEEIASYDQALKFKPDNDQAWYNRGSALENLGRYEEAIASYDQALKFKPDNDHAWYNRG